MIREKELPQASFVEPRRFFRAMRDVPKKSQYGPECTSLERLGRLALDNRPKRIQDSRSVATVRGSGPKARSDAEGLRNPDFPLIGFDPKISRSIADEVRIEFYFPLGPATDQIRETLNLKVSPERRRFRTISVPAL